MSTQRPPKRILHGDTALLEIAKGVHECARTVGCTMGPKGRNVLIRGMLNMPTSTKDGVTVVREVIMEDDVQDFGAEVVKQAAERTVDDAGDGTTATVILADALVEEGLRRRAVGNNVIQINNGMLKALGEVTDFLDVFKKDVETEEEIEAVATISSQSKEVGRMIAKGMMDVGELGTIVVDMMPGRLGMFWDKVDGMFFNAGLFSEEFYTDAKSQEYNANNVAVVLLGDLVRSPFQLVGICETLMKRDLRNVLFIGDITGEALQTLKLNRQQGRLYPAVIRPPAFGAAEQFEIMKDIGAACGSTVFSIANGLPMPKEASDEVMKHIGIVDNVRADKKSLKIIGWRGGKQRIEDRMAYLKTAIAKGGGENDLHRLRERLARFGGGIGRIRVGGATEFQAEEMRYRVDDAVSAARSAMEEGIVPGGGVALLRALQTMEEIGDDGYEGQEKIGREILMHALKRPAWQIAHVAGESGDVIVNGILEQRKPQYGYDYTNRRYDDMFRLGIVDPKKVVRCSIENAVSVAMMILNAEASITDLHPEVEQPKAKR